jgi:hypothetical protein
LADSADKEFAADLLDEAYARIVKVMQVSIS